MYSITTDPVRHLVRITIEGMIGLSEVDALYREEHAAVRAMGCRLGDHLALVDLTRCALQFQDVVAAFERQIRSTGQARRLAIVTGASIVRMQARRILNRPDAALFSSLDEAEAWLCEARAGRDRAA